MFDPHGSSRAQDGGESALPKALVDALPGGVVHVLADGSIVDANAEALRILGMSFDQLTGRYTADFESETIWEDGSPCAVEDYPVSLALATGEVQGPATIGVRRPDGEVAWAVFRAAPLKSATGEVTGAVATFLDITARRQAEQEVHRNRELLRRAQEIAHVGSWEWDMRTGTVRWTDELHDIYGIPKGDFDGRIETALSNVHPDDLEMVSARTQRILEEGVTLATEYRIIRPDGSVRVVWGRGQVIRDESGEPFKVFGAVQDVTERRELEEQLRHSQRMDSIGQLAGGVAHDFNNLLQVIMGNIEQRLRNAAGDAALVGAKLAAERGAELTRQLLSFSRRQRVDARDFDLNELVSQDVPMIRRMLGVRYTMALTLADGPLTVNADWTQLAQVLLNLCINARDALPEGGEIRVSTEVVRADAAFTESRGWADADADAYVKLSVEDSGAGMGPEVADRAFEPFFTTKPMGEGTGLGLSVVYGIAQSHGGTAEVDSVEGRGTTASVYLPRVSRSPLPAPATGSSQGLTGSETVLVVEDEPLVRALVVEILGQAGYRVLAATGGVEALKLFAEEPDVALMVTDVVMPDMDGPELVRQLRKRRPDLRVLFTTGYVTSDRIGDARVLSKPYATDELLRQVREALTV